MVVYAKDEGGRKIPVWALQISLKERRACEEYLVDFNSYAAWGRAGYSAPTARQGKLESTRFFGQPYIKRYVQYLSHQTSVKLRITQEDVLEELARIAFSDMKDYATWSEKGVKLKTSEELDEGVSVAISEIKEEMVGRGRTRSLKLHSKMDALKILAKYVGLTNDLNQAIATVNKYGYELVDQYVNPSALADVVDGQPIDDLD